MPRAIITSKVTRRKLEFDTIENMLVDVDRIVEAEQAGTLKRTGNWTTGQIFGHLAAWVNYGYEGYPLKPPPFFIRWILHRKGRQIIKSGMPAGVRIPGVSNGTFGVADLSTQEGAEQLKAAFLRLKTDENCEHDSPGFGPMSHQDRIKLNLRHAELHLGFLQP